MGGAGSEEEQAVPFVPWHFQLGTSSSGSGGGRESARGRALTSLRASAGVKLIDWLPTTNTAEPRDTARGDGGVSVQRRPPHHPTFGPAPGEPFKGCGGLHNGHLPPLGCPSLRDTSSYAAPCWRGVGGVGVGDGGVVGRVAALFQQPPPAVGLKLQVFLPPRPSAMIGRSPRELCF